ncbi:MAG: glycine cleavage system aminomethyltransferase GcvT [Devosiaceae bacterium]|nr:glycine cleavage system aminomethyltransferase GcvT [Devosiaceae bacterium]
MNNNQQLIKTSLYDLHIEHGARMVDFAGYELPIQYKSIVAEHNHTREQASLFDVSHMGQIIIKSEDFASTAKALEKIIPANIIDLKQGEMRYSTLLNENGGIIDDLIITRPTNEQATDGTIFIVVNGATKADDFKFIKENLTKEIEISFEKHKSLLALQGPKAASVLSRFSDIVEKLSFMQSDATSIKDIECNISRSGYTGEDGFEISLNDKDALKLAKVLLDEPEVEFAGLGARDSLRLEAGLCLYGHDMNEEIDPISASIIFAIGKQRRIEGGFIGEKKILQILKDGAKQKRVGIIFEGRMPVREGAKLVDEQGNEIGYITSGTFSPILQKPIAMGYLPIKRAKISTEITAIVRNKQVNGEIVKMPFVANNYYRGN